jgi:isocitrate dehydrogenase
MSNSEQDPSRLAEQYDKLASKFNEIYLAGRERGRAAMEVALDKAQEQLTALGEFSAEQGKEFRQYLARDLEQTMVDAQKLGDEAKERLHPARLGAGALASLAAMLEFTSQALHAWGDKTRASLTYTTGEMTTAGTLTCQACGQQVHLKRTGRVPPCPKCNGTVYTKGY